VGDVILLDKSRDTGARRELHMAAVIHGENSDYTQIKSIFDSYCKTMGLKEEIAIIPFQNTPYIEGRAGKINWKGQEIGSIGELHPEIIINFGLDYPTAAFEINLTPFLTK
jgi:phenylalanyl-tRNA synthetase beta chain